MDFEEIICQPGGAWDVQRAVQALPAVVSSVDQNNEIIVRGGNYGDKASSAMDVRFREGARDALHLKLDVGMAGYGGTFEGPRSCSPRTGSFGMTAVPNYYAIQGKATYDITLLPVERGEFSAGVYIKNVGFDCDLWVKAETLFIYDTTSGEIICTTDYIYQWDFAPEKTSWKSGGYFQFKRRLNRLTLTTGIRYDYFDFTDFSCVLPRAVLSFAIFEDTDLNLAYSRQFQSTSWQELASVSTTGPLKSKYTD